MVNNRFVDVQITGSGEPTVVCISCSGGGHREWESFRALLPRDVSCLTYGRPGIDESAPLTSDERSRPQTLAWAVDELRGLLSASRLASPYVLVTGSVGGWIGDAFAARHPEEVAGLVLIDATPFTAFEGLDEPRERLRDGDEGGAVFDWNACLAELQERKPDPSLTRTLVLSSALDRWLRNEPLDWHRPFTLEQVEARWRLMQAEWSARLHAPRVVANTGGHLVHKEQPELAAAVVSAVVKAVRAGEQLDLDADLVAAAGGKLL